MIAPTPGPSTTAADSRTGEVEPTEAGRSGGRRATPDWASAESRARAMLERLGRADHPDAEQDPIHALYQVAVDYRCSAYGYRELYLHHVRMTPARGATPS